MREAQQAAPAGPSAVPQLFTPFLRGAAAVALLAVLVIGQSLRGKISDPDLWWHLKTGAIIVATRQVPRTDPYSYSAAGQPWTAHEWLSEVLFYGIWRAWGPAGMLWFRALMLAAVVALMYLILRRRSGSFAVAIFLALGVALATSSFWSERPHLFTYLFLAALIAVLDLAAAGRTRLLWGIPPLVLLWANLHGGFFSALILMGAVWIGCLIDVRCGTDPGSGSARLVRPLPLVILLSMVAASANPQGPAILVYPLRYISEKGLATYISEWQVPNVKEPLGRVFEVLLLAPAAIGLGTALRWAWRDTFPFLVFAHLGLSAVRHVPIFALISVTALAGMWPSLGGALLRAAWNWRPTRALLEQLERDRRSGRAGQETAGTRGLALVLLLVGLAVCWRMAPRGRDFRSLVKRDDVPVAVGEWLQANASPGRVFNYYDYGGFLIYLPRRGWELDAGPPPWQVVIDGREDLYGGAMMQRWFREVRQAGPRWREFLDDPRYRADLVIWPMQEPLTRVLEGRPGEWEKVYTSPGKPERQIVIFRRRGAAG